MTNDITLFDENELLLEDTAAPPLCLVHYFGATGQGPPPPQKGRIAERHGNLIVLEFAPPPKASLGKPRKPLSRKVADTLFLLLLLVSLAACVAAFRF
jgi:hypothetical protein